MPDPDLPPHSPLRDDARGEPHIDDAVAEAMFNLAQAEGPDEGALPPTVAAKLDSTQIPARGLQSAPTSHSPAGAKVGMWQPPSIAEAAQLFPNNEVLALLGRGGMGAVYKARQIELDRLVAIKLLPLEISADPDFADRFRREARAMAKLNHPNIITVHDFGTTSAGHLYFTMEFIEGANLHQMIHGPGIAPPQALGIIIGVCEALAYAHGKGVVHRDIKPANVMVSTDGQVKVADFGLARLTDTGAEQMGHTMTGTVMGTPDYMAPEQMRGMNVDHRADIYSLGVMLYEMLCKDVPRGFFEPPSVRAGVDSRVDEVVKKAMQQQPERRYQQTGEMKADVAQIHTTMVPPTPSVLAAVGQATRLPGGSTAAEPATLQAPAKPKRTLLIATVVLIAGAIAFVLMKRENRVPLASAPPASEFTQKADAPPAPAQETLAPGASKLAEMPEKQTPAPSSATAWQPLFTEAEWRSSEGQHAFKNGAVELQGGWRKPYPSADGVIRAQIRYQDGAQGAGISIRDPDGRGGYSLGLGTPAIRVFLIRRDNAQGTNLAKVDLPAPLKAGDTLTLELRAQGNQISGRANGLEITPVTDTRYADAGQWGITGRDAVFESVEVQRLPGASPSPRPGSVRPPGRDEKGTTLPRTSATKEPWQSLLSDPTKLLFLTKVEVTPQGLRMSENSTAYPAAANGAHRDGAIRLRTSYGGVTLAIRARASKGPSYQLYASGKDQISLLRNVQYGSVSLATYPLKQPLQPGQEYELELRVIGCDLTAKFNGDLLGTVSDANLKEGNFGIAAAGTGAPLLVKTFEFLDLDPPATAPVQVDAAASPASTPISLKPGVWFKAKLNSPTEPGLATTGQVQNGRLLLQNQTARLLVPPMRDGALQMRVAQVPKHLKFSVRSRDGYGLSVVIDGTTLNVFKPDGAPYGGTYGKQPLVLASNGSGFTVQFAHTAGSYVVCIDGKNVASGSIAIDPQAGTPAISAEAAEITSLEVLNLDNVPRNDWPEFALARDRMFATASTKPAPATAPATATKDAPFENTLGMKFVPVPGTKVLFSIWDTRVQDYATYAAAKPGVDGSWQNRQKNGIPVAREPGHPVAGVNWDEAQEFCRWLTEKEVAKGKLPRGAKYRLPTDEEWSIAAGLSQEPGETPAERHLKNQVAYPWGVGYPPPMPASGNYGDSAWHEKFPTELWIEGYTDGYVTTSPVGSFPPNANGLYDMGGNLWQWCDDWLDASHKQRLLRGASWYYSHRNDLLLSVRHIAEPTYHSIDYGFRCVLEPPPSTAATKSGAAPVGAGVPQKMVPGNLAR